jgi:periplasmic protein TonB
MKLPFYEERGELLRWLACGAIVVLMHGAVAAAMIHRDSDDAAEPTAALVVDLAPFPVSPPETSTELPPGPPQVQAEASPQTPAEEVKEHVEKRVETGRSREEVQPELTPAIDPEVALAALPPKPEQVVPQESQLPAPETTAPPEMPEFAPAEVAAAPVQGAPSNQDTRAIPTWRSAVVRILERNKRYPRDAHNARGTAHVAFSLDRRGHVIASRIMAGSGSVALDRAALDLIARSQPFPPPPAELAGSEIHLTVPVQFNMR